MPSAASSASSLPVARTRPSGKKRRARPSRHDEQNRTRSLSAETRHSILKFALRRIAGGLYVEREELPRKGTRTSISLEFSGQDEFERWWDDDPCRFDDPLLYQRVRRAVDELWSLESELTETGPAAR